MAHWYSVDPVEDDFLVSAPHVFRYSKKFAAPVDEVWGSLTSDDSLAAWGSTVSSVNWLSPRPFGVGTTREVALAPGLVRVRERFFGWEEGRRYSFCALEANAPLFRHFAEDYVVEPEPSDPGSTRFTWTVALEPAKVLALPFKPLAPVLRLAFGKMAADGERHFVRT